MGDVPQQMALTDDERRFFDVLEERGEASVVADLDTRRWGARERDVRKWLLLKQQARDVAAGELARRTTEATEAAAQASERSAQASEESAVSAKQSAKHAKIAWLIAGLSLFVSVIALFLK
ncbi:hypothetical protein ACFSHT_10225 [Paraburkholderia silviterrae]|uniref:Uncharacterized protein n=1 Tax=Paraburkholderia silviterrae TaxID=2528715 RepID=A0A4R5MDZ1_9BURK|nr:hypothetical protein [Paraburkholderia silviterrae]TDG25335.1 hypothetical protein EYW47_05715 [Paraburkholderia silviterrae]